MDLKAEVLDRLLLSKFLLGKVGYQPVATNDRYTLAGNIITSHDAAELAIAAICDALACLPRKGGGNIYLMDYFDSFRDARHADIPGREYFRNLNTARNGLKHQGLFPDIKQWARVGETVFHRVAPWCQDYLDQSFTKLDESALIIDADVKRLYNEARASAEQEDYKTALEKLSLALSKVFDDNEALRGFQAGDSNAEDAIRVLGFGIHGNDFLALQQFLPRVPRWGAHANIPQWKQSGFGHPGNWHAGSVQFCFRNFH